VQEKGRAVVRRQLVDRATEHPLQLSFDRWILQPPRPVDRDLPMLAEVIE
jgi:hypothetical protein